MSNQNIEPKNNNKGFLNIIFGLVIGVVLVTGYFKVSDFLEERKKIHKFGRKKNALLVQCIFFI